MFIISILGLIPTILLLAAVIPGFFILVYVYKKDSREKEPLGLLIKLLFWGGVSTIPAVIFERLGGLILSQIDFISPTHYNLVFYFLVVALSEEVCKYVMLRRRTWNNLNFDSSFDGIVYAVFVSLGFALVENILYVFSSGLSTALIRAVTAIPGHASFGIFMGVFYGLEKRFQNEAKGFSAAICSLLSLLAPILLHGLYDFAASTTTIWTFLAIVAVMFLITFLLLKSTSESDHEI